jgi:hypothetical protein
MPARDVPGRPPAGDPDSAHPLNRAERRGKGRKAAAPSGHGKVRGSKFGGATPRQYQHRKH